MTGLRLVAAIMGCGLASVAAAATDYRAPSFTTAGVVNAATNVPVLAPYSICTIYGTDLYLNGAASSQPNSSVPGTMGGVTVMFGLSPAGIFYVSANQINVLIPNSILPGTYAVTIVRDGVASLSVPVVVQEVTPGLFAQSPGFAVVTHADGTFVTALSPAVPGEVVVFYATGLGRAQPNPSDLSIPLSAAPIVHLADFQMLFDGVALAPALVQYVGVAPYNAGLYQVNVQLPDNLSPNDPQVQLSVAGALSPPGLRLITGPLPLP